MSVVLNRMTSKQIVIATFSRDNLTQGPMQIAKILKEDKVLTAKAHYAKKNEKGCSSTAGGHLFYLQPKAGTVQTALCFEFFSDILKYFRIDPHICAV